MNKVLVVVLIGMLIFSSSVSLIATNQTKHHSDTLSHAAQYENGYRYNIQGWIYVHIEGDPYERGVQHGVLLAEEIIDILTRWSNTIHNRNFFKLINPGLSDSRYHTISEQWWNYCIRTCQRLYADKIPDEYQQEMQGIADGVTLAGYQFYGRDVTYYDILALNVMYEFISKLERMIMGIHPLRTFLYYRQPINQEPPSSGISSLNEHSRLEHFTHHCNGFIATGDATTHGQIVISNSMWCGPGSWWWTYYICLRWNIILDVQPTTGHRIQMAASPGFIWSDHDFYQNDAGIVLLETTLPQGMFDTKGYPLAVRARTAMQYGESIDDVVYYLRHRNDGAMNAVWLIGDTKTGEIARLDLGYRRYSLQRTFDGFYWSANNPEDLGVRLEKIEWRKLVSRFLYKVLFDAPGFGYHSIFYRPESRDIEFEELGNFYYGNIDVDVVKTIMSAPIIMDWSTDCKITDTSLVAERGMWAFWGCPAGKILNITNRDNRVAVVEEIHPTGWVRLFSLPEKENFTLLQSYSDPCDDEPTILWQMPTASLRNDFSTKGTVDNETVYMSTSSGTLKAIATQTGALQWKRSVGAHPTRPVVYNDTVYVGSSEGISSYSLSGEQGWKSDGTVVSGPFIVGDQLVFGEKNGSIFAYALDTGEQRWHVVLPGDSPQLSASDTVVYGAVQRSVYAMDATDGAVLWTFTSDGPVTAAPVYHDGIVVFGSWDTNVYTLNASTGAVLWSYEMGWGVDVSPLIVDDTVFVGSVDNNMYALDRETGALTWVFTMKAAARSAPVFSEGNIIFGSDDGRVYCIDASSGTCVWVFAPGYTVRDGALNYQTTPIRSDIVVGDSVVYFGASGILYATVVE